MTRADRVTVVWVILMAATVATTWVLAKDAVAAPIATTATMAVAAWKVRLVVLDFMELRSAPVLGRMVVEAWAWGAPAMILIWYFAGR